jgi:phosphate transport system permease protein
MAATTQQSAAEAGIPVGEAASAQVAARNRRGRTWLVLFQLALLVAIVALLALLYSIVDDSFGLVAVENAVDPSQLMTLVEKNRMLSASNATASEDDEVIAAGVASSPYAVGFFGYAYFQEHADELRALTVEGIAPTQETVDSGEYPLARPLFLYAGENAIASQPAVANFLNYYLANVSDVISEVGYFPVSDEVISGSKSHLTDLATDADQFSEAGEIRIAGSSTVHPLTQQLLNDYREETSFSGTVVNDNVGTRAGFSQLCVDGLVDIANASRAMSRQEAAVCEEFGVGPVEFRVGSDALSVVVSQENTFIEDLTAEDVDKIFSSATLWSEVRSEWPSEPIQRFIPGEDSGTLDFFAEAAFTQELSDLTTDELILILQTYVSKGVIRRLESEKPLTERSQGELYDLVVQRVVEPKFVASWSATESILRRDEIEQEALASHPEAVLEWYAWLNMDFLTSPQSSVPEQAGVRTAILGTLWVILVAMIFAIPIGIGTAIYLEEYAGNSRLQRIIQTNIDNLAGVPSIIYGILGLTVFVRVLEPITSGAAFGVGNSATANGRTVLSAGLTLALLVLPVVIINAQEAIRAVPRSLREAGYGLGGTKWQVTRSHVLANALPGIFTGTILAMSRAIGETAPLIVIGASTFITVDPSGPFSKFTVLPMQIYQWTSRPQDEFRHIAAATSIVLLVLLLILNGTAVYLRNRFSKPV